VKELLVATFYKFTRLEDHAALQEPIRTCCESHDVRGIVLLAREGINATIAGSPGDVRGVMDHLRADPRLSDLTCKESWAARPPFRKLRVRLKKEIVTMGVPDLDPAREAGRYVKPEDWNELISDPDVILVDTRNDYEVAIGTFDGAINPGITTFGELPGWLEERIDSATRPRVAMFCTGGIRCEKSTAFLRRAGVEEVFHLEGGILKYLERIPESESRWEGECFVFDERVAVRHGLASGSHELCRGCRRPIDAGAMDSDLYRRGVSCPHCHESTTKAQKDRFAERQRQIDLARDRDPSVS